MDEEKNINDPLNDSFNNGNGSPGHVVAVSGMFRNWFLDYASYVILERAVPAMEDGLKPVQRRILHSLKEMDDGRYHKVANIIGHSMKYHPHGDQAIGDALVQIGQKDLLIDTQGNWGNILTGDRAAAPRYIEARLTKFALEVSFNPRTTEWQASYDGRGKEPINLPVKFPLLLTQGAEGIAVGLSTRILPHNFNEIIDASVQVLRGRSFKLLPDFPTGGLVDVSQYNDGQRGGRIKVRARIGVDGKKKLVISEIPFGTTTTSLIESILKAHDKGKIKIKKVEDNTAEQVEIVIHLHGTESPDKMIDALYAFTDCEVSIAPNACVIANDKPEFSSVSTILKTVTERTLGLLKAELKIKLADLQESWHMSSLERIFIAEKIYRDIETCESWDEVIGVVDTGMHQFISTPSRKNRKQGVYKLLRDVTEDDIIKLTEIRIKRISKYDLGKADESIARLEASIEEVKNNLGNLVEYAISYFKELKKKYGADRKRKTEIREFAAIEAAKVAVANVKLYVNKEEGFVGYGLRRTENDFICDCSDIDDVIVIRRDGVMQVSKISDKAFFGKDILFVGIWKRGDNRTVYNMAYSTGKSGKVMVKRFAVTGVTRDKAYNLCGGEENARILYFSHNPNGEAETIQVHLRARPKLKKTKFDFDFSSLAVHSRNAKGNILTKYTVNRIILKEEGVSTLSARKLWFDEAVLRLNTDGRGIYLGAFEGDDQILQITQSGDYILSGFDLFTRFEEDLLHICKYEPGMIISAVYYHGSRKQFYVKRFEVEAKHGKSHFISEDKGSYLELASVEPGVVVKVHFSKVKGAQAPDELIDISSFIDVKGAKALGNRLSSGQVKGCDLVASEQSQNTKEGNNQDSNLADTGEKKREGTTEIVTDTPDKELVEKRSKERRKLMKGVGNVQDEKSKEKPDTGAQMKLDLG